MQPSVSFVTVENFIFKSGSSSPGQCLNVYFDFVFRELQEGTLKDNGLMDESKIILIPNVETGLLVRA